ncbi:MAG: hypothetical protein Ta2B_09620 [Termitinemataceae bacterium]|nr:MAG: hypothetical protein Ta2B_09620 [Termitinemataceae bacterium]
MKNISKVSAVFLSIFFVCSMPVFAQAKKDTAKTTAAKKTPAKKAPAKTTAKKTSGKKNNDWIHSGLFSAGAGFTVISTQGSSTVNYANDVSGYDPLGGVTESDATSKKRYGSFAENSTGGYLFFDATYAEFDLSFSGASGLGSKHDWTGFELGLALLGKYPFKIGKSGWTISPIAGFQFDLVLAAKDAYGNLILSGEKDEKNGTPIYTGLTYSDEEGKTHSEHVINLSAITFKIGAGATYPFTISKKNMYFSIQYLFGFRFETTYEKRIREYTIWTAQGTSREIKGIDIFNSSSTFKLAIGYKF